MTGEEPRIKVLLGKMGLMDLHDTGIKVVAQILRDEGMEVIYTGLYNTAQEIVNTALEEDVDIIGMSFHAANYINHSIDLMDLLRERGSNATVVCGGVIKTRDIPELKKLGIAEVFLPGTTAEEIVRFINNNVALK